MTDDTGKLTGRASGPPGSGDSETDLALEQIRTLFDYSAWARDRLLGALEGLSDEQLKAADRPGVYGSIHDTLAHLAASEWMWLHRAMGDPPERSLRGEDFADLRALVDFWNTAHSEVMQYVSAVTSEDLNTSVTYIGPDGKRRTRKVWHMLLQVTNHQTEHRAQIGTMLGQMGIEVPATDLVVYLSEKGYE